ncbi:VirB8/TrbF family protein [Undibacterium arcticum]
MKSVEDVAAGSQPDKMPNPYLENRRDTDDRYMNLAVSRQNWIRAFQIASGLLAISISFNGYYMTQSKFIPYIVEVDKIGHIVNVGVADKSNPIDKKRIIRAAVMEWVENSRVVMSDQLAFKKTIETVYAHVLNEGKAKTVGCVLQRQKSL